jgi:hypothetical protein
VVTAVPEARTPSPPCLRGARWAAAGAVIQIIADALLAIAFCNEVVRVPMFATGIPRKKSFPYFVSNADTASKSKLLYCSTALSLEKGIDDCATVHK